MDIFPAELLHFLERPEPVFIHVAAANKDNIPLGCRGYGIREDLKHELVWVYLLKAQWLRLKPFLENHPWLAVLLTSGVNNDSFQIKGTFGEYRALSQEDEWMLERQRIYAFQYFPHLALLQTVDPSECLAIGVKAKAVYLQTPGPQAGYML